VLAEDGASRFDKLARRVDNSFESQFSLRLSPMTVTTRRRPVVAVACSADTLSPRDVTLM
jgi:hypothetical protein